jgi:hypothetical protein
LKVFEGLEVWGTADIRRILRKPARLPNRGQLSRWRQRLEPGQRTAEPSDAPPSDAPKR